MLAEQEKRGEYGRGGGGKTKMPVSVSRERETRVVEGCWREGIEGGSREDKNGRVNEKREKSRAALRFQTHRYIRSIKILDISLSLLVSLFLSLAFCCCLFSIVFDYDDT